MIVGGLAAGDVECGAGSGDDYSVVGGTDPGVVGAVGAVGGHGVGLAVADAGAGDPAEVEVDLAQVGRGEIVDGDRVSATAGGQVELVDSVQVHGYRADVAEQPHAGAVGRNVDVLAGVRAVELEVVVARAAFDCVTGVAGVPHEGVVTGAEQRDVIATAAGDDIVTPTTDQDVITVTADQRVVTRASAECEVRQSRQAVGGGDRIVATAAEDLQAFHSRRDLRCARCAQRGCGDAAVVGGDWDRVRCFGT